jgi:carbon storage regulator
MARCPENWARRTLGIAKGSMMLVLTRKVGEKFRIGDDIYVTVVRIADGGVRLGIDAPSDVTVLRAELLTDVDAPKDVLACSGC